MKHYLSLETAKYWNAARDQEAQQELASRNRNATEAFITFLVGLLLIAAFKFLFFHWYA